jgi:tetratricopeptide (TPR) repeat protein
MKLCGKFFQSIVLLFLIAAGAALTARAQNNNSINGRVYDAQTRQMVGELFVELQDSLGISITRGRTDSTGRFFFGGLRGGTYNIKVLTFGTNYEETTQMVNLVSMPIGRGRWSSDIAYVDIMLKLDPRRANTGSGGAATVVFVQEIPDEARKSYKKGVDQLADKKDEGLESLKKAVEIFPTYFDALDRLGAEYVLRKQYDEAAKYLIRAIDVNRRSFSSYYALGIASYNLKNLPAAIEALNAAIAINPQSVNAHIFLGMILRIDGNFEKAEKELLQAKKLAESSPVAEIHWQLALLYEKMGRNKKAADELERYLKLSPKAPNADQIKRLIADLRARQE